MPKQISILLVNKFICHFALSNIAVDEFIKLLSDSSMQILIKKFLKVKANGVLELLKALKFLDLQVCSINFFGNHKVLRRKFFLSF